MKSEGRSGRKRRHQGRVVLAPRHVTPVVNRLFGGYSTKATTGDEASSTAIKARLVASAHRALAPPISLDVSRSRSFLLLAKRAVYMRRYRCPPRFSRPRVT